MTESNTGLTNNKAEIAEYYNVQGVIDENSSQDDDISGADLIISVSTGAAIRYIIITILLSLAITAVSYVIIKKVLKDNATI